MKRFISIIMAMCLMLSFCAVNVAAEEQIKIIVDGKAVDCSVYGQEPVIDNGRTLVPLRAVFEALGASVEWDGYTRTVTSVRGEVVVSLQVGANVLLVNDVSRAVDVPACIMNDRTMVPVRAVAEAFGCTVEWDGATRTVIITTEKNEVMEKSNEEMIAEAKVAVNSTLDCLKAGDMAGVAKYYPSDSIYAHANDLADFAKMAMTETASFEALNMSEEQKARMTKAMVDTFITVYQNMEFEFVSAFVADGKDVIVAYKSTMPDTSALDVSKFITQEELQAMTLETMLDLGYSIFRTEDLTQEQIVEINRELTVRAMIKVFEIVAKDPSLCDKVTKSANVRLTFMDGGWKIIQENGVPYMKYAVE